MLADDSLIKLPRAEVRQVLVFWKIDVRSAAGLRPHKPKTWLAADDGGSTPIKLALSPSIRVYLRRLSSW